MPGQSIDLDDNRQGPMVLAVGAGGVVWTFFFSGLPYLFSFSLSQGMA